MNQQARTEDDELQDWLDEQERLANQVKKQEQEQEQGRRAALKLKAEGGNTASIPSHTKEQIMAQNHKGRFVACVEENCRYPANRRGTRSSKQLAGWTGRPARAGARQFKKAFILMIDALEDGNTAALTTKLARSMFRQCAPHHFED